MTDQVLVTLREAAHLLDVHPRTVERWWLRGWVQPVVEVKGRPELFDWSEMVTAERRGRRREGSAAAQRARRLAERVRKIGGDTGHSA